jgi:lysophospholipase L1-like esterase
MVRLLATVTLAFLFAAPVACSSQTEKGEEGAGDSPRTKATHREATDASDGATTGEGGGPTTPEAPAVWDYVALGDSLAAGVGASHGYVDRYAEHLHADTGARIRVTNLGVSGQTSAQLLHVLRDDASARRAIGGAEVITFNIGINDLGRARGEYEAKTCGGARNERCLRAATETLEKNWDTITEEILALRPADEAIIRTAGLGYTQRIDGVIGHYLQETNSHITASTAESGIPYAEVSLGADGLSPDGLHPDGSGYAEIADHLERLGYEPLEPSEPPPG